MLSMTLTTLHAIAHTFAVAVQQTGFGVVGAGGGEGLADGERGKRSMWKIVVHTVVKRAEVFT